MGGFVGSHSKNLKKISGKKFGLLSTKNLVPYSILNVSFFKKNTVVTDRIHILNLLGINVGSVSMLTLQIEFALTSLESRPPAEGFEKGALWPFFCRFFKSRPACWQNIHYLFARISGRKSFLKANIVILSVPF